MVTVAAGEVRLTEEREVERVQSAVEREEGEVERGAVAAGEVRLTEEREVVRDQSAVEGEEGERGRVGVADVGLTQKW